MFQGVPRKLFPHLSLRPKLSTNSETSSTSSSTSASPAATSETVLYEEDLFENIDGQNIGYSRYGHGPNHVLCICGGVGSYRKDWPLKVLEHFDPTLVTIVCIDPPGYGTSRPPDRVQEVNRCMKDGTVALKLMRQINHLPFTAIGWSEGARTAIHVTGQGKEDVKRVVLMAAGTRISHLGAMAFAGMRNTDHWLPGARAPYLAHYDNDFLKKQWGDLCEVVRQVHEFCGGRFPSDYVLPTIKCPMLICNGGQDRFCADVKTFLSVVKHAKVEVQAQGNHDFHHKYPKWFAEKVQNFIKST